MSKISLAEAVKLKSVLSKRIHELEEEMDRVAFMEIEKGSKLPKQIRTLSDVEHEMEEIRKDFRLLDKLMYQANYENKIVFNNETLTIVEAIELATQLRAKARKYKEYGASQKEEYLPSYGEMISLMKVAAFDPEAYRLKGIEVERQANRLSNLINAKNYSIELDFDSEKYF
jgi:CRISPR/Cas system CMR subunit Cmr4 (Cas7 group RAMP superfamily)